MSELQRLRSLRAQPQLIEHRAKTRDKIKRSETVRIKPGTLEEKLFQAGIFLPRGVFLIIVGAIATLLAYVGHFLGVLLGVFLFAATAFYFFTIYLDEKSAKRRNKIIPHLPAFIDGLASALGTGFNLEAAVMQATESVPMGLLRVELDRVVNALKSGLSLEESFLSLRRRVSGREVISLGVSVVLFHDLGGRMLEPFRRLAEKVREQQLVISKAQRDLVQIRLAFNIILFLSVIIPLVLVAMQPSYMNIALGDWLGRILCQLSIIVQVSALLFFKRTMTFRL